MKNNRKAFFISDNGSSQAPCRKLLDRLYALKDKAENDLGIRLHWWQVINMILDGKVKETL